MSDNQQQRVDGATCDVVSDALHGNVDAVRKWLHGDGRYKMKKQAVVLDRAAEHGHTDICQLVIDCTTVSTDGLTRALHAACWWGHLSMVQLVVSTLGHYCDTQRLDDCLHIAASHGNTEIVNWLLPLTQPTDADYMRWDLVQASARGDLTHVTQLVNTIGRDVTDVMSHALWTACYWDRFDIVDWLVTHTSADVNYSRLINIDIGCMTSLAIACYEGEAKVVKRLLIDPTLPCDISMVTGVSCDTALPRIIGYSRETPLQESCMSCNTAAVFDAVYECDVNMQDRDGMTAMHYACINGHLEIVKVLLSVFADIDITDDYGDTPMSKCVLHGSPELAHYIQQNINHFMSVSSDD